MLSVYEFGEQHSFTKQAKELHKQHKELGNTSRLIKEATWDLEHGKTKKEKSTHEAALEALSEIFETISDSLTDNQDKFSDQLEDFYETEAELYHDAVKELDDNQVKFDEFENDVLDFFDDNSDFFDELEVEFETLELDKSIDFDLDVGFGLSLFD